MRAPFLGLLIGFLAAPLAQAEPVSATAYRDPGKERLTERAPVSGRSLVGVVATRTDALPKGAGLISGRLWLGGAVNGPVCMRARSEDGLYEAEYVFDTVAAPGRVHALNWSERYIGQLRQLPLNELAALATAGECDSAGGGVIPTGMDVDPAADGRFLQVLVNTRGATTWAVLRDPAKPGPALARARCVRLAQGARVAFDASCTLPMPPQDVELRLEQEGRDGLSLELVAKAKLLVGPSSP